MVWCVQIQGNFNWSRSCVCVCVCLSLCLSHQTHTYTLTHTRILTHTHSTRQDRLGKGVEVRSGNGPLGFCIRYGEFDPTYESPSLGCTAHTVLCVAIRYPSSRGFVLSRQMLLQHS